MKVQGNGLRRLLKTGIGLGAHWSRLDRVVGARRGLDKAPLVVAYHRVVQDFERSSRTSMPSLLVSTKTLERHLDWIGQRYRFVSLDELARHPAFTGRGRRNSGADDDRPMAVVTFDDGYRDVYRNAFPLLKRKGIPFTVYVVTDLVGTNRLQLHDELYLLLAEVLALDPGAQNDCWNALAESFGRDSARIAKLMRQVNECLEPYRATRLMLHGLSAAEVRHVLVELHSLVELEGAKREEFLSMDWEMLQELVDAGVTVASHTRSHALLATESEELVKQELEGSRRELELRLGVPIRHMAYPDGSFNANTIKAVNAAGYVTATTVCRHGSDDYPALAIPRRPLWENACKNALGQFSPAIFSCQVNGFFDVLERCPYEHG